jgi:hypothetical protein
LGTDFSSSLEGIYKNNWGTAELYNPAKGALTGKKNRAKQNTIRLFVGNLGMNSQITKIKKSSLIPYRILET